MIQANELRIGNWVNVQPHNKYAQIIEIKSGRLDNRDFVRISSPNLDTQFTVEISQINPIPLTEEILLKAGFEKDIESLFYRNSFIIAKTKTRWAFYHNGLTGGELARIDYIHELQNLIFALTGKEIKIEL